MPFDDRDRVNARSLGALGLAGLCLGTVLGVAHAGKAAQPPPSPPLQLPDKPSGLDAINVTETSFTATWTPAAHHAGKADAVAYRVYGNGGLLVATTTTTRYTFTGLRCRSHYTFGVSAVDSLARQ